MIGFGRDGPGGWAGLGRYNFDSARMQARYNGDNGRVVNELFFFHLADQSVSRRWGVLQTRLTLVRRIDYMPLSISCK